MPTTRQTSAAFVLVALAAGLPACDQREAAELKVNTAKSQILANSNGGLSPAPDAVRTKSYNKVTAEFQGDTLTGPAGKLLSAQATLGLGDIAAGKLVEAEGAVYQLVSNARAQLELYLQQDAMATASTGHDRSADMKQLQSASTGLANELDAAQKSLAQFQAAATALQDKSKSLAASAKAKRVEGDTLRAAAAGLEAEPRLNAVKRSVALQREGDALEVQQGEIELQMLAVNEKVAEAQRNVARIQRQIELTAEAMQRVKDSDALRAEQARASRELSKATAAELAKAFDEAAAAIEQHLKPAFSETKSKYSAAASAAQSGQDSDKLVASLTIGAAKQALAGATSTYAATIDQAASLAARISAAPNLPDAAKYQKIAETLSADVKPALEDAAGARSDAANRFASAGAKGDAGEMLKRLSDRLSPPKPAPEAAPEAAKPDAAAPAPEAPKDPPAPASSEPKPEEKPAEKPAPPAAETPPSTPPPAPPESPNPGGKPSR